MDNLDKMYKIKKFLKTIYGQSIGDGNILNDNQYIRILQNDKDKTFAKASFFNDIDVAIKFCAERGFGVNTYFELATTNDKSGSDGNMLYRHFLGFDFDKKTLGDDFTHENVRNLFKEIGLWFHAIIDSGNGFHAYVIIEKTNDLNKVMKVQEVLQRKLNADKDAIKTTQLLRIPYTYNVKYEKPRMVRIIHMFDKDTIKPYSIDKLYSRYCTAKELSDSNSNYIINTSNMPICINNILTNGSNEGDRNSDLQKLVISLRIRNKKLNEIISVVKEWNNKCIPCLSENELVYQTEYIFENLRTATYDCKNCANNKECWKRIESDFEYSSDEELIIMSEKHSKDLKHKKRKDAKTMNGNELFIYNVLLNNKGRQLNIDDILELITFKKKSAMSLKTLRETLSGLVYSDYISKKLGIRKLGIKDTYEANTVKSSVDSEIVISYFCTLAVVWGIISPEELRLYTYMRYKQHLLVKEEKEKGNVFRISQSDLAKDLGITQQRISVMINNLIESKIIDIWENRINDRGFIYYIYRLNK